jgi:hypothetical protein
MSLVPYKLASSNSRPLLYLKSQAKTSVPAHRTLLVKQVLNSKPQVTSIIYTTTLITITECPESVTSCPARTITSSIPYTTVCPESTAEGWVVPPPWTPPVMPPPPPYTQVIPGSTVSPPCSETTGAPGVSPWVPPPVKVASSAGGEVVSQTSAGPVAFTGGADVTKAGSWGLLAGFLFALL